MKYQKNPQYDYEGYGVSEENGYAKWYHWDTVKKHVTVLGVLIFVAYLAVSRLFKEELASFGKPTVTVIALVALAAELFIVTPLHEILHLVVPSKGKLDDKCVVTLGKGTASAMYDAPQTRTVYLVGLILPVVFFAVVFTVAAILTSGKLQLFFIYLLFMSCYGGYTDIYMFFYALKHIKKNDIVFGVYKKTLEK